MTGPDVRAKNMEKVSAAIRETPSDLGLTLLKKSILLDLTALSYFHSTF